MTQNDVRDLLGHLEDHHPGERMHGERVAVYAVASGDAMGLADEELLDLRMAAALHDIGKLDLPAELLSKRERLEGAEVLRLREHVLNVSEHVPDPKIASWIGAHHERWDGAGYPRGLSGELIPLASRIIAVAETFDVLLHDWRWREPMTREAALEEVRRCAGTQFDPRVVGAFLSVQSLIQPVDLDGADA